MAQKLPSKMLSGLCQVVGSCTLKVPFLLNMSPVNIL